MALRIALLTWEYPPRVVGEMATYVQRLVGELAQRGHSVTVVTFHDGPYGVEAAQAHVQIHRVSNPVTRHTNIVTWVLSLTAEFQRVLANLCYEDGAPFDIVDAHEWHCVAAAAGFRRRFGIPFVYTAHSLEEHRAADPSGPLSSTIRGLEWLGGYESRTILTPSTRVMADLQHIHAVPRAKIRLTQQGAEHWVEDTVRGYRAPHS
jgi:glycosyltransferase involved in cell wall biosynthesis